MVSSAAGAAVSTSGPLSVMAIVCSKWALGRPSMVDWVQWSGSVRTFFEPMLTIGSTAITSPGSRSKSWFDKIRSQLDNPPVPLAPNPVKPTLQCCCRQMLWPQKVIRVSPKQLELTKWLNPSDLSPEFVNFEAAGRDPSPINFDEGQPSGDAQPVRLWKEEPELLRTLPPAPILIVVM